MPIKLSKLTQLVLAASLLVSTVSMAEEAKPLPTQTLFTNVKVWDGSSEQLTGSTSVLIENNLITKVGAAESDAHAEVTVIDGAGRTLMPGLIDMHSHMAVSATSLANFENTFWEEMGARTALVAHDTLMDGFTTVRDVGCCRS